MTDMSKTTKDFHYCGTLITQVQCKSSYISGSIFIWVETLECKQSDTFAHRVSNKSLTSEFKLRARLKKKTLGCNSNFLLLI